MAQIHLNLNRVEDYRVFLRAKSLPRYRVVGHTVEVPEEYAHLLGVSAIAPCVADYQSMPFLFDYQGDISRLAINKRKFAVFAQCGLGKSLILLEFARHVASVLGDSRVILVVSPLMVIRQTISECQRFYGEWLCLQQVRSSGLQEFLDQGSGIGITNYEAIREGLMPRRLGALILDESSMLKSMYGRWGRRLIHLGAGLDWKLCLTGTPAPNDRIEYANHAVFLDRFRTTNAFLSRYFVNRGETSNRWELKAHALRPFYHSLSDWCIFLENPATYGWKDNTDNIPPIHVHIHDVPMTDEQVSLVSRLGGDMYGTPGGITSRSKLSQLAKGRFQGKEIATNKPNFVRKLIESWPDESTIIWCRYNQEQEALEKMFPDAGSIKGKTGETDRANIIQDFQEGRKRVLISKPECLGYGLNLQVATRQVFSTLEDSYEEFHQAVKRSNRIGSTLPLNVHLPVTEIERPMIETVLTKANRVQQDSEEQERLFRELFQMESVA